MRHRTRVLLHTLSRTGVVAIAALGLSGLLVACAGPARLQVSQGTGPDPVLPPPEHGLLPVVDIAPAVGWPADEAPAAAPGLAVNAFATGLDHPRWLYVLPNGDVLVAETDTPPDNEPPGLKSWIMGLVMKRAGSGHPSADRIRLLRDGDGDGVAETRSALLTGLHSPFGMALVGETLYVANSDALVAFPYRAGQTRISAAPSTVAKLPSEPINHHWTKSLLASRDGRRLYVGVGSNSNVAEHGMAVEQGRASIHEIDPATGTSRIYASGLRNPVGMDWEPATGALWVVVNERDELGSDLVPDYLTAVREDGFYGWPYSYYGRHVDMRVQPQRPDLVARALVPDYALGPHTASLGLAFYTGQALPQLQGAAIIGQHGSWNRKPPSGYRVIAVPFRDGRPAGPPTDLLTGFVDARGRARGRPVGVAVDARGAILVADDVGGTVWRITPAR